MPLAIPLALRPLPAVLLLLLLASPAAALTRTVQLDGSGDYTVIQDALIASTEGDTVLVGPGNYTWTNQGSGDDHGLVRYWQREQNKVTLRSSHGPQLTILDAEGQGRVFFANGDNLTEDKVTFSVSGFTMRNGYASKVPNRDEQEGGAIAMHECEAVIEDCIFEHNEAEFGGGVWMGGVGAYEFRDCDFHDNLARLQKTNVDYRALGGGAYVFGSPDLVVFERCTFTNNHADYRGGGLMTIRGSVDLRDCLFSGNTTNGGATRHGTAIYAFEARYLRLNRVTVRDHDSAPGAAVYVLNSTGFEMNHSVIANTISGLTAHVEGSSNISASCSDLYGGFPADWLGQLIPFRNINNNLAVDPLFCAASSNLRRVEDSSPMLAVNNACGEDIGLVLGSCAGVPVLASGMRADRGSRGASIQWSGVTPASAGLQLERQDHAGVTPLDLVQARAVGSQRWAVDDATAPATGAEYRLLDRGGQLLARATLPDLVSGLQLLAATPNPFNPRTVLEYELAEAGPVSLEVFDSRGRHVATLVNEMRTAGPHSAMFTGTDDSGRALASGVYHLRLQSGGQVRTRPVVLLR